jgi:phosphatidylglycerophosphate synthase
MQYFEIPREQTLMIGDKRTADIKAANKAGVESIWVEKPHGEEDLLGDRVLRRPVEKYMHKYEEWKKRRQPVGTEESETQIIVPREVIVYKTLHTTQPENLPEWKDQIDEKIWQKSKIVNLGGPVIENVSLNDVKNAEEEATSASELSKMLHDVGEKYGKQFDDFMLEHGRKIATASTLARIPLAVIVAGLILTDRPVLAQGAHGAALFTDWLDGWASRKSKEGGTKEGGKLDQRVDKFYSVVVDLALAKKDGKNTIQLVGRLAREVYVLGYSRPKAEREGKDTSAVMSGKISTNLVSAAQFAEMTKLPEEHPVVNGFIQYGASGSKWYSAFDSQRAWDQRLHEQKNYEEVTQKLVALAA